VALEALLQEIANLQKTRVDGRFTPTDPNPLKIGFLYHIEEITQILGFKKMTIVMKRAEYASVYTNTVDLESHD
jgi:hypothetical protein